MTIMLEDRAVKLTSQQRACLRLVHEHLTSKEIAPIIGIEPGSVDQHIKAAMRVLGVTDRRTAARILYIHESKGAGVGAASKLPTGASPPGQRAADNQDAANLPKPEEASNEGSATSHLLPHDFLSRARAETQRRAAAYEGFWRSTRPCLLKGGQLVHDYGMFRLAADGLLEVRMGGGGLSFEGWATISEGNAFCVHYDTAEQTPQFFIFKAVPLSKPTRLKGIMLFVSPDASRTPAALPVILDRIGKLSDDSDADKLLFEDIREVEPHIIEGEVPEEVASYLLRDIGPAAAAAGGTMFLIG